MMWIILVVGLIMAWVFPKALITAIRSQDEKEAKNSKDMACMSFFLVVLTLALTAIAAA